MTFAYRAAAPAELSRRFDALGAGDPEEPRWPRWRERYLDYNARGLARTFLVLADGEPVGDGTLLLSAQCAAVRGRRFLADGQTLGNVNALRIDPAYARQGHASRLMAALEDWARGLGLRALTIGVEAREARNRAIYQHWGFTTPVAAALEDGEPVLYYRKELSTPQE